MTFTATASWQPSDTPLTWRKSSACPNAATCVEVAGLPGGGIALRDGKNPDDPFLTFTAEEWTTFLGGARAGDFDPARP